MWMTAHLETDSDSWEDIQSVTVCVDAIGNETADFLTSTSDQSLSKVATMKKGYKNVR